MPPDLIAFPHAAVATAASELRRMAGHLDGVGGAIDTSATAATVDWRGGHRDDFDVFVPGLVQRHGDLATQLRNLAGELEDAAASVTRENQRRTDAFEEAERQRDACSSGPGPARPQIPC